MIDSREQLEERLGRLRERVAAACRRVGRDPAEVRLVAVTKGVPPSLVSWAMAAGVEEFGENYVQELAGKRAAVGGGRWHYVGTLQSHTAHRVADHADLVHTLEPGRAVDRLSGRALRMGRRIPVLIQVDLVGGRRGTPPEEVASFARSVARAEGLELVGLMTLPPMPRVPEDSRPHFRRLREIRDALRQRIPTVSELSMGMSIDYEVAAEEGATMIRVGTALFGERPPARQR